MIPFFTQKRCNPIPDLRELYQEAKKHPKNCHVRQKIIMKIQEKVLGENS
jgi:hypothetical protein